MDRASAVQGAGASPPMTRLALPIKAGNKVMGVLVTGTTKGDYSEEEVTLLHTVTEVLGIREVAAKELGPVVSGPSHITGAALMGGGDVVLILDAGAGTGMTGKLLFERGYRELAAMDISQGMLEQARSKNVYKAFHQMVMGEPLDFPSDSFDAVVSVGALTHSARALDFGLDLDVACP